MVEAPRDGTVIDILEPNGWVFGRWLNGAWREYDRGSRKIQRPMGWRAAICCPHCSRPIAPREEP
jgi:hypothetical protein